MPEIQKVIKRLEAVEDAVRELRARVDRLEESNAIHPNLPITTDDLLKLPDSLRKSMIAIINLKEASAETTAKRTNRTRGIESIYLNQLVRMGYLEKIKKGRRVYFRTLRTI